MTNLPDTIYSEADLERARGRGKVVGWIQGAGVVLGGAVLWNLLGWIPVLVVLGVVGWVLYKVLGSNEED